jgi:hypothetical protein
MGVCLGLARQPPAPQELLGSDTFDEAVVEAVGALREMLCSHRLAIYEEAPALPAQQQPAAAAALAAAPEGTKPSSPRLLKVIPVRHHPHQA